MKSKQVQIVDLYPIYVFIYQESVIWI